MRIRSLAGLLLFLLPVFSTRAQKESDGRRGKMGFAEKSFVQTMTGEKVPVIVGLVTSVTTEQKQADLITGSVLVSNIVEVSRNRWKGGSECIVRYMQYASDLMRIKSGSGGWNRVDLRPGIHVVLAVKGDKSSFEALSVKEVASTDDSLVKELAWISQAEDDPGRLGSHIREAVLNGRGAISRWGHYSAGPLHRLPRSDAAAAELEVLGNPSQTEDNRMAAAINLELELWNDDDSTDVINHDILNACFSALIGASKEFQTDLLAVLYRLVIAHAPQDIRSAREYRGKLRQSISLPSEKAVLQIVLDHARTAETPEEKQDMNQLAQWIQS